VGLPRVNPHNGPYLASADARRGQKWAVSSIDSVPLKIARRPLVVQAVGAPAPSAQRRCRVPAVSASTIVLPAPHVARTRTCAGDLRIPLMVIHASFRLSLAAPATHLLSELLTPQAGPARSVTDTDGQIDTEGECTFPRARRRHTGAPLQERIRPPVRQRHISRQGLCASAAFQRQLPWSAARS
jgi:hypothetical protein